MAKPPRPGRSLDDLQSMAIFVRVVEEGSFTAAARALDTTTSAVSKRIAHLEERLGVRLFERTTRALAPTEAARIFYERCVRILRDIDEAEDALLDTGGAPRGTLRVTAVSGLADTAFMLSLSAFAVEYPDLRVELDLSDRRANLIEEGFDLGIRGFELGAAPDSSLIARRLAVVDRMVCGAPSYLARRGVPRTIEDFAHHDCLHFSPVPLHREWGFKTADGPCSPVTAARFSTNSITALRAAAIAGVGLIRGSTLVIGGALREGALVHLLHEHTVAESGLFAVYPAGRQALPKVKVFVDFLLRDLAPRLALSSAPAEP